MRFRILAAPAALVCLVSATAQTSETSKTVKPFVRVDTPTVVLTHVRVIDGTGAPAVDDQNVTIAGGRISAIGRGADVAAAPGATVLDLHGYTVMPGIVGMHNHLFYVARPNLNSRHEFDQPVLVPQMTFSAPRLYLAGGITTLRTTGSVETYADLNLKRDIERS
jgi:imidazolonepropionase-like amidohydrolase